MVKDFIGFFVFVIFVCTIALLVVIFASAPIGHWQIYWPSFKDIFLIYGLGIGAFLFFIVLIGIANILCK